MRTVDRADWQTQMLEGVVGGRGREREGREGWRGGGVVGRMGGRGAGKEGRAHRRCEGRHLLLRNGRLEVRDFVSEVLTLGPGLVGRLVLHNP